MRADFYRLDAPGEIVGRARWVGSGIEVETGTQDDDVLRALSRIFRRTPVVVDDPALRLPGATGPAVLPPGSLRWFRLAAAARCEAEGLGVRLAPEGQAGMGWDPAGGYRSLSDTEARRALLAGSATPKAS